MNLLQKWNACDLLFSIPLKNTTTVTRPMEVPLGEQLKKEAMCSEPAGEPGLVTLVVQCLAIKVTVETLRYLGPVGMALLF